MEFQDLSEDNIRSIFSFCDIYAVVSMSRTNKYFRQLTLEKLVWVDLVDNLRRKGFVDQLSISDIRSHSQEPLVALVKRLLTGPACWNPPIKAKGSWFRSTSSHQSQIPVEMFAKYVLHPPGIIYSKENATKLLNGGEYVLFNNTTLECWSVQPDKLIWAYDKNGPESHVFQFAAEMVDGGSSVNIIVCERSWTVGGYDQSLIQIVKLDFNTGNSTRLLLNELPDTKSYGFTDAKICGSIASAVLQQWTNDLHTPDSYCILMDWKTNSQLKLASNTLVFPPLLGIIWVQTQYSN
ncbi:hypothetical protein B0H19DRAFT_1149276 [Mycena capillaripes]|nr:hypothetical protein B0H19DRAFT_1149276 [Mycena capillaripes]